MGIFDVVARASGSLRPLSDEELADEREAVRLRHVSGEDHYDELHRYDDEMVRPGWPMAEVKAAASFPV